MHLLIIDAMNVIRRVYAAVEGNELADEATRTRSLGIIMSNLARLKATHLVMVFEHHDITWRHEIWPTYKEGRSPMPQALADDLASIRQYLESNGVHCYDQDGWEADDIIATIAVKAAERSLDVTILSTDKGFCQLVSPKIKVLNHFERLMWDEDQVRDRWGFIPSKLTDFWALCGDQTNHLPGVAGIGTKGAGQVLDACGSLDQAIGWPESVPQRYQKPLQEGIEFAMKTRVLATLRRDVPVGINLASLRAKA
jgi:protein Xni